MLLAMRSWGSGPKLAVLVHGYTDDSTTWWQAAPALAAEGYTVLAPDLRGHGASARATSYRIADFADDLVETLPKRMDLLLGHSLGALAVGVAMGRLSPDVAVYVDPPWLQQAAGVELSPAPTDPATVRAAAPRWSAADVDVDIRSTRRMDPAVTAGLKAELRSGPVPVPGPARVRSHVLVPEEAPLLPTEAQAQLATQGYLQHHVPATGHVIHRDDLQAFLDLLDLVREVQAA